MKNALPLLAALASANSPHPLAARSFSVPAAKLERTCRGVIMSKFGI
jgi:hypothetical protein